jgi:Fic family protein
MMVIMLHVTPDLDAADGRVLDQIDDLRQKLRYQLAEPRRWQGQLRRTMTARAIQGSNSIEGYQVSLDDAEDVVGQEPALNGPGSIPPEILGYREALTYVQQLADHPDFRYERMLLSALHFMMLGHRFDRSPGRYRTGAIFVRNSQTGEVVYEGPAAEGVPALVDELVGWLNEGDRDAPVFVRAAMAHLNLVNIHPWRDGNGRMSRCLQTLVLARGGVLPAEFSSIEEWLGTGRNTYDYYDALGEVGGRAWTPGRDAHSWVRFCLRAHHLQAQLVRRRFTEYAALWTALELLAAKRGLPDRTLNALFAAARGVRVRRTTYQHEADLTEGQAVRDLRVLAQHNLLHAHGETRGRYYVATDELAALDREASQALAPIREPYPG